MADHFDLIAQAFGASQVVHSLCFVQVGMEVAQPGVVFGPRSSVERWSCTADIANDSQVLGLGVAHHHAVGRASFDRLNQVMDMDALTRTREQVGDVAKALGVFQPEGCACVGDRPEISFLRNSPAHSVWR